MQFRTTILSGGKTATGIEIPVAIVDALGTSRKPAVKVTINGYPYRSTVATVNGVFMIGVSNDVRQAAGVAAGEEVDVTLELDTEPRKVAIPPELEALLAADPAARTALEKLSYSNQRRIVEPIDAAKTPETRQRRIDKAIETLRAG
jgi:hypothetical protein